MGLPELFGVGPLNPKVWRPMGLPVEVLGDCAAGVVLPPFGLNATKSGFFAHVITANDWIVAGKGIDNKSVR